MPFYEYQCKNCGHDLEAMQKISDPPLKKCPHCGKSQLQRLMSAPVFRLKGGGWYETDFKGDKENQRNLADRPEAEAAKESPTDAAKDTAKEGAAAGAEAKGKDGKADATPAKDATSKDAPAAKPAEKAPAESAKKAASSGSGKSSLRGRTAARGKTPVRRPIKKPAPKAKRRR
jgi:putative FmdB family regulatory protein